MRWMMTTGLENIFLAKLSADGLLAKMKNLNKIDKKKHMMNQLYVTALVLRHFFRRPMKKNRMKCKTSTLNSAWRKNSFCIFFIRSKALKELYAFSVRVVFPLHIHNS